MLFSNALAIQKTPRYYIIKWLTDYIADMELTDTARIKTHGRKCLG
jgi:hypothetical protein